MKFISEKYNKIAGVILALSCAMISGHSFASCSVGNSGQYVTYDIGNDTNTDEFSRGILAVISGPTVQFAIGQNCVISWRNSLGIEPYDNSSSSDVLDFKFFVNSTFRARYPLTANSATFNVDNNLSAPYLIYAPSAAGSTTPLEQAWFKLPSRDVDYGNGTELGRLTTDNGDTLYRVLIRGSRKYGVPPVPPSVTVKSSITLPRVNAAKFDRIGYVDRDTAQDMEIGAKSTVASQISITSTGGFNSSGYIVPLSGANKGMGVCIYSRTDTSSCIDARNAINLPANVDSTNLGYSLAYVRLGDLRPGVIEGSITLTITAR